MKNGQSNVTKAQKEHMEIRASSGNVFEDLRVPGSAEALAKAEIAARIVGIIRRRGLTQSQAANVLGIDQPSISDLVRGKLRGFSSDRLFRFLNVLGQDVEIMIRRHRSKGVGRIRIAAVARGKK
jgi:predicted XRE-type DNA-binding protein